MATSSRATTNPSSRPSSETSDPQVVIAAVTGAPDSDEVIAQASMIASAVGARLFGLHVRSRAHEADADSANLLQRRTQLAGHGGTYVEVAAGDAVAGLAQFATEQGATHVVVGASRRRWWQVLTTRSMTTSLTRSVPGVVVHVVPGTRSQQGRPTTPSRRSTDAFDIRRVRMAWMVAAFGPIAMTIFLRYAVNHPGLATDLLMYLPVVIGVAVLGGHRPAIATAFIGFALANYFFTPPIHTFSIDNAEDLVALCVYIAVAFTIGTFVSRSAIESYAAGAARTRAETLASLAGIIDSEGDPIDELLGRLRSAFRADGVALYRIEGSITTVVAADGGAVGQSDVSTITAEVPPNMRLAMTGGALEMADQRMFTAFAASTAATIEQRRLRQIAERSAHLEEVDNLRNGLLSAVSHDLRTPLAVIKASASTLRQPDIRLDNDVQQEFLATIEQHADRLGELVSDLLDLGRIRTGSVVLNLRHCVIGDVLHRATFTVDTRGHRIMISTDEDVPEATCDPSLLERALSNILDNACRYAPDDTDVDVTVSSSHTSVLIEIADHGRGVDPKNFDRLFEPFQRLHDRSTEGTGLGLAIASGLCEAMGCSITPEQTPGGGLTMSISVPAVSADVATPASEELVHRTPGP